MLDQILTRASRRHLVNVALDYVAVATGAGALGAIALLFLGTQILDWYWPVLLFIAGLATGAWKLRRRHLSRYSVAQMLDERLGLADRLSTLVWFREQAANPTGALATVEQQANGRLHPDDAKRAIPFRTPRHAYASLALILSAAGLFGVRYFVLHTLDLGEPLARIDFGSLAPEPKVQAATKKSAIQERFEKQLQELGLDAETGAPDEDALQPVSAEVPGAAEPGAPKSDVKSQKPSETSNEEGGEQGEGGEEQQEGLNSEGADQQAKEGKPQQGNPPPNAKQGQQGSNDNLMNKMRDALANLMNKLKNQNSDQGQQQMAMNQQQQPGKQSQQNQQGMQSKSQGQGQQSQDQQGDQDQNQQSSGDRSKAGEKNADQPGSESSKSGMGLSDGEKAIKDAEQIAAMGKISEILGKRAQQLTGEITVEVSSGKQNLKTAWTERKALHADTGGEVNRDEIPLAYQSYIQRYFEEIRKTTPKPARAGS
jgi:hypothetical protein